METGKKRFSENANLEIRGNFAEINLGKVRVALLHGGEEELLRALIKGGGFDIVVHGHTHKAEVYKSGRTLVVNPGEVCATLVENRQSRFWTWINLRQKS
jgi:putative phosphoesterase